MERPLTPLEFMRRARRLYASREAVVDGIHRWTYEQFFDRCGTRLHHPASCVDRYLWTVPIPRERLGIRVDDHGHGGTHV